MILSADANRYVLSSLFLFLFLFPTFETEELELGSLANVNLTMQIEWQNHTYTFCLHRPERTRVFYLKAESEKEMKDWIHAVDKVIKGTMKNKSDGMKKKRDSSTFVKKNPLKKSQGAQKELQKKESM